MTRRPRDPSDNVVLLFPAGPPALRRDAAGKSHMNERREMFAGGFGDDDNSIFDELNDTARRFGENIDQWVHDLGDDIDRATLALRAHSARLGRELGLPPDIFAPVIGREKRFLTWEVYQQLLAAGLVPPSAEFCMRSAAGLTESVVGPEPVEYPAPPAAALAHCAAGPSPPLTFFERRLIALVLGVAIFLVLSFPPATFLSLVLITIRGIVALDALDGDGEV